MGSKILINVDLKETRVAITEEYGLAEIYVERHSEKTIAGNIYKGRVVKILPGMDAAFVDIGIGRAGFLYVSEVSPLEISEEFADLVEETQIPKRVPKGIPIEDILQEGQEVLVQVAKEPLGSKGPRLTSHITLPGRYLILMPTMSHIGVSHKITDPEERKRLKEIVSRIRPQPYGFIVRTVSEGKSEEQLLSDMEYLISLWGNIKKKAEKVSAPYLLYADLDLPTRALRDFFNQDTEEVIIDDEETYKNCLEFAKAYVPKAADKIVLYKDPIPLFTRYGIEEEINKALEKKVWLKSGGYIVIEETEALTAIDVNTGKFVGKSNLEETIFQTNLEAAREIAHQIRVRNIGGIIIIDFIDMASEEHREEVLRVLQESLKKDRYPSNIQGFTELGLVIMTRKRVKESLLKTLCSTCPYCHGKSYVKPPITVCHEIYREIKRVKALNPTKNLILIEAHPSVAKYMIEEENDALEELEKQLNVKIRVQEVPSFHQEQYKVRILLC
ncbi:ribonuclease G [Thermosulfidibacter takaii ABI70S6]|uniref:Ribonuclease G n=1 Tax=Thermosulfidibacter takaii (strain DSM 17441 / JCM 13301 / NBRC 103674 / ABI70S6) TaxID=1298851 RepID=A0A0S3QSC5_THET7|nr:Rne/Rng family ribonuclease [Thermosulfidibacter takaii]BAT71230.1 ribonuclease G [Thermosulfidibacter takaii ABI70S6]